MFGRVVLVFLIHKFEIVCVAPLLFNYIENHVTRGKGALHIKCVLSSPSETFIRNIFSFINIVTVMFEIHADTCIQEPIRAFWFTVTRLDSSRSSMKCTAFRNREKKLARLFSVYGYISHCSNVDELMTELGHKLKPEDWQLFIASSKLTPKEDPFFDNGNDLPLIPVSHDYTYKNHM
jgi:hypothetical protein